jgi:3'(2'), 5'-bisphosphate nucleotidase
MRQQPLVVERKQGNELVTDADRRASELVVRGLRAAFPDDVVISEEEPDDPRRATAGRVWFVDPIDGTRDYIKGLAGFAAMIGLAVGGRPALGVVVQPIGARAYAGRVGEGASLRVGDGEPRALRVSAEADPAKLRTAGTRYGSLGLRLLQITTAERDAFIHLSNQSKTWDTCAPAAIVTAAGGTFTDPRGAPLRYDGPTNDHPLGFVASNGAAHAAVLARLAPIAPSR